MNEVISAIVLCAGRGKRLQPHTDATPKPLLPVAGKPTLDFILDALSHAGIKRIVLVTHHLAEQIEAYVQTQKYFPIEQVICVKQDQLAGTADATLAGLSAKPEWFSQPFILTASDYLIPQSFYKSIVDTYTGCSKAVGVSLKQLPDEELAQRSSVRFDDNGDVLEVVEKPAAGCAPSNFSANLIFVLPADIIDSMQTVSPSPRGEKEIQSAINEYLSHNGPACCLVQDTPAEWQPSMQS